MESLRVAFEKDWDLERRNLEVAKLILMAIGRSCKFKLQIEKEYEINGNFSKVETEIWEGPQKMELMLKTATSALVTYE